MGGQNRVDGQAVAGAMLQAVQSTCKKAVAAYRLFLPGLINLHSGAPTQISQASLSPHHRPAD
ncbi:MAG: hypothetical protein PHZ02_17055, partial [Desulfocapsaceae bacterium]|nr:hypothetical protein [Desulfocapsaceae bacterium]